MASFDSEFVMVDDRGERRVFDPIGNSDLTVKLEKEWSEARSKQSLGSFLLRGAGGLALAIVFAVVLLIASAFVLIPNLANIGHTLGSPAIVTLVVLVLAVMTAVVRYEPMRSKDELQVSLSMWRRMHECCGNCGSDLSGNSIKDDGCSICDACGGAWLRFRRLPPPQAAWSWRDAAMLRSRFRYRDMAGNSNVLLPFREGRELAAMYGVSWLPRGYVLVGLLAAVLAGHAAF